MGSGPRGQCNRIHPAGLTRGAALVIAVLTTIDRVKLSAAQALLRAEAIDFQVFDTAAGGLWTAIIPIRLVVDDKDLSRAKWALRGAGFVEAADGDWDLRQD